MDGQVGRTARSTRLLPYRSSPHIWFRIQFTQCLFFVTFSTREVVSGEERHENGGWRRSQTQSPESQCGVAVFQPLSPPRLGSVCCASFAPPAPDGSSFDGWKAIIWPATPATVAIRDTVQTRKDRWTSSRTIDQALVVLCTRAVADDHVAIGRDGGACRR